MENKKSLTEWFENQEEHTPGIMKIVSQPSENQPEQMQQEPQQEPEKEEVKETTNFLKAIFSGVS